MTTTGARVDLARLGALDDLPSPPAVCMEILRLSRDPDTGLHELAEVLTGDPAMSAKVVRLANSVVYRRRGDVVTVSDAAMRIGLRTLEVVALGFSVIRQLPTNGRLAGLDVEEFWRRSVTVAVVARKLARQAELREAEEAFILGLLTHLGRLVLAEHGSRLYQPVLQEFGGWPTWSEERGALGFTSLQVAVALLESWELPSLLVDTLDELDAARIPGVDGSPPADSNDAATGDADPTVADVLRAAVLADQVLADPTNSSALVELDRATARVLGSSASAETVLSGAAIELAEASQLFDIGIVVYADPEAMLAESRRVLLDRSVGLAEDLKLAEERTDALKREVRELEERVREDSLTRLPNRNALDEFLSDELEARRRGARTAAIGVLLIDIDRFKDLNDLFGHQVGDHVLQLVAASLSSVVRRGEILARYGGEEFLLVAPACDVEGLLQLGERLRRAVEDLAIDIDGVEVRVTVSVGGACASDAVSSEDGERLVRKADGYLYRAKRNGRNRTEISPESVL